MDIQENQKYVELIKHRDLLSDDFNKIYARYKDSVSFGDFTYGFPLIKYSVLTRELRLIVGKFCSISENVKIMFNSEHRSDWITTYPFSVFIESFSNINGAAFNKGDITIGNDVWIGEGVTIMSGVTIGDGCVIGTNALVTKDIPAYSIVGGVPAKVIKYRFDQEIISTLLNIKWWDWPYEDIVRVIPTLQSSDFDSLFKYYSDYINKNDDKEG